MSELLAAAIQAKDTWHLAADVWKARAEAAEAKLARVEALHFETEGVHCHSVCAHRYCKDDSEDQHRWPCPTIAAIDGAPEPEFEYGRRYFDEAGNPRIRVTEDVSSPDGHRADGSQYWNYQVVRRRKAGPWLPVEGESRS